MSKTETVPSSIIALAAQIPWISYAPGAGPTLLYICIYIFIPGGTSGKEPHLPMQETRKLRLDP